MNPAVEQFLLALPEEKRMPALKLRELFLSVLPTVEETIKWRNLTYVYNNKNIAFIYTYPKVDYINLGFLKATSLSDPNNLFEGTGTGMRHIKIRSSRDIPLKQLKAWIKDAAALK